MDGTEARFLANVMHNEMDDDDAKFFAPIVSQHYLKQRVEGCWIGALPRQGD